MKGHSANNKSGADNQRLSIAYFATLLILILGAFLGGYRAWGINVFAYLPLPTGLVLFAILAAIPFLLKRVTWFNVDSMPESPASKSRPIRMAIVVIAATVVAGVIFYLLRATTHFLGDGYSLLANLAKFVPYQKFSELGTDIVVQWVARTVNVSNFELSVWTYQLIAIGTGALLVASVVWFAGVSFSGRFDKILFTLLSLSSGQMLLFFGYVENYALLSVSSALFVLVGIIAARRQIHRLIILAPLTLALFFHLLAVVLVPAAIYLLFRDTTLGRRFGTLSVLARWGLILGLGLIGFAAVSLSGERTLFLQLTIVPLIAGEFSARGYTLLSSAHLIDYANLLFLLCPGILICLAAVKRRTLKSLIHNPEIVFVGIVALWALLAAFLLDPKLGMARDWDLLWLAGFPLSVLAALVLLERNDRVGRSAIIMASAVGLAALLSRALVQHLPERGAQYAEDVMKLDLARSRNAFTNLIDYHASIGDTGKSAKIKAYRQNAYPEVIALKQVSAMFTSGQLAQGKQVLDAVIERTPDYAEAWAGLCIYHYRTRQYDSALHAARIADGLNPNNPAVLFNMGLAEYSLGNPVTAEKLWLKSVRIDSSFAALSLAHLYRDRKDTAQYSIFLFAAASRSTARPDDLKEAIQLAISRNQLDRASQFILRYRALGVDSGWVDSVSVLYPTLK